MNSPEPVGRGRLWPIAAGTILHAIVLTFAMWALTGGVSAALQPRVAWPAAMLWAAGLAEALAAWRCRAGMAVVARGPESPALLEHVAALMLPAILALGAADRGVVGAPTWIIAGGAAFMAAGIVARCWAIAAIGPYFLSGPILAAGQPLVSRGPYRLVRHPSELGLLLLGAGCAAALWSWLAAAAWWLLVVFVVVRIGAEERVLRAGFGRAYEAYARQTGGLWPRAGFVIRRRARA